MVVVGKGSTARRRSGKLRPIIWIFYECRKCYEPLPKLKKANTVGICGIEFTNVQALPEFRSFAKLLAEVHLIMCFVVFVQPFVK